jgi:hypothetical protein
MGTGLLVAGAGLNMYSQYQQGLSQNKYYQYLAQQNELQAKEVKKAASQEVGFIQEAAAGDVERVQDVVSQTRGTQETGLAASGVSLSSKTAEDIARATFDAGMKDEAAIRYNADVSAWQTTKQAQSTALNLRRQAQSYRASGEAAKKAGYMNAFSTLLGGASSIYNLKSLKSNK